MWAVACGIGCGWLMTCSRGFGVETQRGIFEAWTNPWACSGLCPLHGKAKDGGEGRGVGGTIQDGLVFRRVGSQWFRRKATVKLKPGSEMATKDHTTGSIRNSDGCIMGLPLREGRRLWGRRGWVRRRPLEHLGRIRGGGTAYSPLQGSFIFFALYWWWGWVLVGQCCGCYMPPFPLRLR